MIDNTTLPNEEESVLKKTRAKNKGGMLSDAVQSSGGVRLPNAIANYRERAADLYQQGSDLYNSDPDITQLQQYAKSRGGEGQGAMLNALAAQFAGENFQPVQAQYLKRAAAAQEPMKVGGGVLTPEGQFVKDPFAAQDKKAEFLLQQAKAYENMAITAETARERMAAQQAQNALMNQYRMMSMGMGGLGTGNAQQIGSGANNEPVFRQPNGQLFTYDANGQPIAYAGGVQPKANSSQPTEDERKAAGWFFQADNARRNMAGVIAKNPGAAYNTVAERAVGFVPGVGADIQNAIRPEDRQKFVQAAGSMSEALLRAATGAGINAYEANQKVNELVPQLGDKPGTVKQKMDAYDMYMSSLKTRAGRAIPGNTPGAPAGGNDDPLGLRGK